MHNCTIKTILFIQIEHVHRPTKRRNVEWVRDWKLAELGMMKNIVKSFCLIKRREGEWDMRKIFKDTHAWAFSTLSRLPSTYKSELYESIFLSWVWIFRKQWLWGWRKLFFLEIERAHISSLYIRYIWEDEMCTYILRKLGYSKRSNIGEVL